MRPLDPRLMRYARSTRGFLALTVVLGAVTAALVILQARLLSSVIVSVTSQGAAWSQVQASALALAGVFAVRALIGWLGEAAAVRTSAAAKQELREAAVAHVLDLGPAGPGAHSPGETSALITRGVDALDGYYARYLPQLVLAVIVPLAVLFTVLGQDILSAVIIAVTIPLIPVFMVLIGLYTRSRVDRQWRTLARLSGHFLDLVSGLPTLKAFGRATSQAAAIRAIGDEYRRTTMGVLRVSFLSSLVLELLATLAVALVAVSVGLRLAEGQMQYSVALFVLLLAPEAYLPLRLVGQHFHAAAEGLGAAQRLIAILETPVPVGGSTVLPSGSVTIEVADVRVRYAQASDPAVAGVSFTARPGTVTAIVGSSGGGKSTLLNAILGFLPLEDGGIDVQVDGVSARLGDLDMSDWRARVSWVPQRPTLVAADLDQTPTVGDVVRLGKAQADASAVDDALRQAGLDPSDLPDGQDTVLAEDGSGLSVGQMQRLAMARALVRGADVLLLDEPTAALDPESEAAVVAAVQSAARNGATVIVVAHRPALMDVADQLVRIEAPTALATAAPVRPAPHSAEVTEMREGGW